MKLWIASDHAGFALKEKLKKDFLAIKKTKVEWVDLGTHSEESIDYPIYGKKMAQEILAHKKGEELYEPCGVLICGSGVGVSIAANRFEGIRAVLAANSATAKLSREHNASNVLCLGARLVEAVKAMDIVRTWLETPFEGGRHERRVKLMDEENKKK